MTDTFLVFQNTLSTLTVIPDWLDALFSSSQEHMMVDFLPHILIAIALGGLLGWERRVKGKVAGVRTHVVMSASACVITICGVYMGQTNHAIDPTRLAAQILSGIGFVGAGVILRRGATTSGVTTASTILFASGVGIAAGFGYFALATLATLLLIAALFITYYFFPSTEMGGHSLKIVCPLTKFDEVKRKFGVNSRVDSLRKLADQLEFRLHTSLSASDLDKLLGEMVNDPDVISVDVVDDEVP